MMERRKRREISFHVDFEEVRKAVDLLRTHFRYERGRLDEDEMNEYFSYRERIVEIFERTQREAQRLIDACRRSDRLTWQDYAIVVY